jgi:uncharacterized protein
MTILINKISFSFFDLELYDNKNASLTFHETDDVNLDFINGLPGAKSNLADFFKEKNLEFNNIEGIFQAYIKEGISGPYFLYNNLHISGVDGFKVYQEGALTLYLLNSELVAELALGPGEYSIENVYNFLKKQNITNGIQEEELKKQFQLKSNELFIVAFGDPNKPARFQHTELFIEYQIPSPFPIKQKNKIQYFDLSICNRVLKNQKLAKITQSNSGKLGKTVTGKIIPTFFNEDLSDHGQYKVGDNAIIEGKHILTTKSGLAYINKNRTIDVCDEHLYKTHVENKTINTEGFTTIRGNVTNSTVNIKGSLVIHGTVKNSVIKVTEDLCILKGIIDSKNITATNNIFTALAVNSKIEATFGKIKVDTVLIGCEMKSKGMIDVGKNIISSIIYSETSIVCTSVGVTGKIDNSQLRITTNTHLKTALNALQTRGNRLNLALDRIEKEFAVNNVFYLKLKKDKAVSTVLIIKQEKRITIINQQKDLILEEIKVINQKLQTLKKELRFEGKIIASQEIYPGSTIVINDSTLKNKSSNGPSQFCKDRFGINRSNY